MEAAPCGPLSERIQHLKDRFYEDLSAEDRGLRHKIYASVEKENPGLSNARRIALSFARFLAEKSTPVYEHDLLAGALRYYEYEDSMPVSSSLIDHRNQHTVKTDLSPMFGRTVFSDIEKEIANYLDWTGQSADSEDGRLLRLHAKAMYGRMYSRNASGHVIPGYDRVLRLGVGGLIEEGERALKHTQGNRDCVEAMLVANRALVRYIQRYGESADNVAKKTGNAAYRITLTNIAEACAHIAMGIPRSFFEAVQLVALTHDAIICESISGSISLGRLDWLLYPFYIADLKTGAITPDEALALIEALWLKFAQLREGFQHVTLGGCDGNGKYIQNELTILCMRASRQLKLDQPLLSLRTAPDMPQAYWNEALALIKTGLGFPALFSDEVVFKAMAGKGIAQEDIWNYGIVGCVEPAIGGKEYGRTEELRLNWAKPIELMLSGGFCAYLGDDIPLRTHRELDSIGSFEEFYGWYRDELTYFAKRAMKAVNLLDATYGYKWPAPLLSATMEGCYERGLDVTRGGTIYNNATLNACAMADTVDSLGAIKALVFEKKVVTLSQLAEILKADFAGEETLRTFADNIPERFGNDNPAADALMCELTELVHTLAIRAKNAFGGPYQIGFYTVTQHGTMGLGTAALPSGRHKGVALANSMSPCQSADRNGPTAVVNSVVKNDLTACANGMVLDMKFSPSFFDKPEHVSGLRKLIDTYFERGGMEIQFNVVSREILLAAKARPQDYRNLIVRVSGYSAYFYNLEHALQDEIIARTEHA